MDVAGDAITLFFFVFTVRCGTVSLAADDEMAPDKEFTMSRCFSATVKPYS